MNFPPQSLLEDHPALWVLAFLLMNPPALMLAAIATTIISAGRGI